MILALVELKLSLKYYNRTLKSGVKILIVIYYSYIFNDNKGCIFASLIRLIQIYHYYYNLWIIMFITLSFMYQKTFPTNYSNPIGHIQSFFYEHP